MAYNREKTERITVDLPKSTSKKVKDLADKTDRPVAAMMRVLVIKGLKMESEK